MANKEIEALHRIQLDKGARTEADALLIYNHIKEKYMGRYIGKYLYMQNSAIDGDDVKGEFWVGVIENIYKVRLDIGNPFAWLAVQGKYKALNAIKKSLRSDVQQICIECGHIARFYGICRVCGGIDILIQPSKVQYHDEVHLQIDNGIDSSESLKSFFKNFFTGRRLQIYELITDLDSETTPYATKNYQKTIAGRVGISAPAVAKHIRIIRQTIQALLRK